METKLKTLMLLLSLIALSACGREKALSQSEDAPSQGVISQTWLSKTGFASQVKSSKTTEAALALNVNAADDETRRLLDELAEIERAGSWIQGMALAESGIRENAGDYAGAVAAAYKEMAMSYGRGFVQKEALEQGLLNALAQTNDEVVVTAVNSILAFARGQWDTANAGLCTLFDELEEPDGFGRWMILVCALETNRKDFQAAAAYKAIRARYSQFPEYWYRGARAFSGLIAAEYAEQCINSSPQGVFADECRKILASHAGLKNEDGLSIKTKTEIEAIISKSLNAGNPLLLDGLMPLISLPDNPYTIYAVGALKALTAAPKYRDYFNETASASKGRLAERLSYICRS